MNVGIVGCGRVARLRHVPALRVADGARLVAVADVEPRRRDALADEAGVGRRYDGHESLLADESVEAVAVCVPASVHAEVAVAALEAGKHVLVEKPVALTLDDAERIREAAGRAHGVLAIGLNLRCHRLVRRARGLIRNGALGEVRALGTTFTSVADDGAAEEWRLRRETGGGAIVELGPHHFDLWRFLLGSEVEEVFAASRSAVEDDETAVVSGRLASGVHASSVLSRRAGNANEIEVHGSAGRLRLDLYRVDGLDLRPGPGFAGDTRARVGRLVRAAGSLPEMVRLARRGGDFVESYAEEWRCFVAGARAGHVAEAGIEDGIRNLELVLAAAESAASGRPVRVEDAPRSLPAAIAELAT